MELAPNASHLYLASPRAHGIERLSLIEPAELETVATEQGVPLHLVAASSLALWVEREDRRPPEGGGPYTMQMFRLRCAASAQTTPRTVPSADSGLVSLVCAGCFAAWLEVTADSAVVKRCRLPELPPEPEAAGRTLAEWQFVAEPMGSMSWQPKGNSPPRCLALGEDGALCWVEPGTLRVVRRDPDGREQTLDTLPSPPLSLTMGTSHVFALTEEGKERRKVIWGVPIPAGEATRLVRYWAPPYDRSPLLLAAGQLCWRTGRHVLGLRASGPFAPSLKPWAVDDTLLSPAWLSYGGGGGTGRRVGVGPTSPEVVVGRHPAMAIVGSRRTYVSRFHAVFHWVDGHVTVEDLGSSNGTWVGKRKLEPFAPVPVGDGDRVVCGQLEIEVHVRKTEDAGEG